MGALAGKGWGKMGEGFREQLRVIQGAAEERAAEERRQLKLEQVAEGRCKVVPHPKVATQPFRTERTVEQHSLFLANRYKGTVYTREWMTPHPSGSGEPVLRRVTIGDPDPRGGGYGVLKQVHQDVFYKLLELWADAGYPVMEHKGKVFGVFSMSAYALVKAVRGDDSAQQYRTLRRLLREMKSIPIALQTIYSWQSTVEQPEEFSLLYGVEWDRKGRSYTVTISFSEFVTDGFLQKNVKTLLGGPYRQLGAEGRGGRGELAKLLYPFLDGQLATKESFHIKLAKLAERFGLAPHKKKSLRKQQFSAALDFLHGQLILCERYVLHLRLDDSSDGQDYVLIARREPNGQLTLFRDS